MKVLLQETSAIVILLTLLPVFSVIELPLEFLPISKLLLLWIYDNNILLTPFVFTGGPVYMIIEYANHGSLKDFLKCCEEAVLKLNHIPQVQQSFRSCRTSSTNSGSSTYPHFVFKLPLSAQNSVFSSAGTPTALIPSASSSRFDLSSANHEQSSREDRLVTQDSGFFGENVDQAAFNGASGGVLTAHTVAPLTHDYVNSKGLLYMEDVQNFALQIACGLKHLEEIQVRCLCRSQYKECYDYIMRLCYDDVTVYRLSTVTWLLAIS